MNDMNDSAFTEISAPGMHYVHMRPVRYYDNIVYRDTIFFACYCDNCHRNNNVLKVRPKRKIQVHVIVVLLELTHVVS